MVHTQVQLNHVKQTSIYKRIFVQWEFYARQWVVVSSASEGLLQTVGYVVFVGAGPQEGMETVCMVRNLAK